MPTARTPRAGRALLLLAGAFGALLASALGLALIAVLLAVSGAGRPCGQTPVGVAGTIALGPPGTGQRVGATEYGGPGDPSSGTVGASGVSLLEHPDSYAELGGTSFQTATAMGGLAYLTPLRVTWGRRSAIAYKRDFGLGGGPVGGLPRVIDLWWQFAAALSIPYDRGLWSGPVRISRPPGAGAGNLLSQAAAPSDALTAPPAAAGDPAGCLPGNGGETVAGGVPITSGPRAQLLPDGQAAAPAGAPAAVKGIIAAGNQIVGKPYLYGGGHGLALDQVAPAYDCSSSVEHLLYGGRLLPVGYDAASGELESFGSPGPGRWVTIYASADHVFMYVAGLRWDTHNAAGPQDGSAGIGWHPLVRSSAGFVARHPENL
jgi:cell wall-associated NlpC family hydrolase